jgi:hypothetical protein
MADIWTKTKEHRATNSAVNNVLELRQRVAREERRQGGLSIVDRATLENAIRKVTPVYDALSRQPPQPKPQEDALNFRRRVFDDLKQHHSQWRAASGVAGWFHSGAFDVAEREVLAAAHARGLDPNYRGDAPPGHLRARKVIDQAGRESTVFHGDARDTWAPFCNPSKTAVLEIRTPEGRRLYPRG